MSLAPIPPSLENYSQQIFATKAPFVCITTEVAHNLGVRESKVGGMPYWPQGKEFPEIHGEPAKLIAQINFSKLTQDGITLPDFPQKGMLQFYCPVGDDLAGMNFDNNEESSIKVIYHEDITQPQLIDREILPLIEAVAYDNGGMVFDGELSLSFALKEEYLGYNASYNHTKYDYSFIETLEDEDLDDFFSFADNCGSKIGGYPFFTQEEVREGNEDWVLLFQLDSDRNVMWGDSGVANWFIRREDLVARNFDRILFTWDCC